MKGFVSYDPLFSRLKARMFKEWVTLQARCPHTICHGWMNLGDGTDKNFNIKICHVCGKVLDTWNRKEFLTPYALKIVFGDDKNENK